MFVIFAQQSTQLRFCPYVQVVYVVSVVCQLGVRLSTFQLCWDEFNWTNDSVFVVTDWLGIGCASAYVCLCLAVCRGRDLCVNKIVKITGKIKIIMLTDRDNHCPKCRQFRRQLSGYVWSNLINILTDKRCNIDTFSDFYRYICFFVTLNGKIKTTSL